MLRYVETYYRHRLLLTAPVALVLLIVAAWVLVQPPSYDATVRLWTEKQTVVPNPNDNPYLTPAQIQSATLTELLSTKYFCVKVGNRIQLDSALGQPASPGPLQRLLGRAGAGGSSGQLSQAQMDDLVFTTVSKQTTVVASGPQMVSVTFQGSTPELAAAVAQAVADQFIEESLATQRAQEDAAVDFYTAQVKEVQARLADADGKVDSYLAAHPDQRAQTAVPDATLTDLKRQDDSLRQQYQDLISKQDEASQNRAALTQVGLSGIRVLDKAVPPGSPSSMKRLAIEGAAIGLGLALLILVAGILLLTLVDSTLRRPEDVEQVLDLRPVGTVPKLN